MGQLEFRPSDNNAARSVTVVLDDSDGFLARWFRDVPYHRYRVTVRLIVMGEKRADDTRTKAVGVIIARETFEYTVRTSVAAVHFAGTTNP